MKIKSYKTCSEKELIKKLRKVILLNSEKRKEPIFAYKNALIELKKVDIKELLPLQLYQLASSNQLVSNLYKIFEEEYKEDIFNMKGYVTYISNDKRYALIPPIIESVKDSKGNTQRIIIDGLHRVLLAKKLKKKTIAVVVIENVPQKLNLPVAPNSWEELRLIDVAPEIEDKRRWLIPPEEGYLYYRNFQSVFQNIGKPRASNIDKKTSTV